MGNLFSISKKEKYSNFNKNISQNMYNDFPYNFTFYGIYGDRGYYSIILKSEYNKIPLIIKILNPCSSKYNKMEHKIQIKASDINIAPKVFFYKELKNNILYETKKILSQFLKKKRFSSFLNCKKLSIIGMELLKPNISYTDHCLKNESNNCHNITRNICTTVSKLHQNNIIHGDLHGKNIIIRYPDKRDNYGIKIIDYGYSSLSKKGWKRETKNHKKGQQIKLKKFCKNVI